MRVTVSGRRDGYREHGGIEVAREEVEGGARRSFARAPSATLLSICTQYAPSDRQESDGGLTNVVAEDIVRVRVGRGGVLQVLFEPNKAPQHVVLLRAATSVKLGRPLPSCLTICCARTRVATAFPSGSLGREAGFVRDLRRFGATHWTAVVRVRQSLPVRSSLHRVHARLRDRPRLERPHREVGVERADAKVVRVAGRSELPVGVVDQLGIGAREVRLVCYCRPEIGPSRFELVRGGWPFIDVNRDDRVGNGRSVWYWRQRERRGSGARAISRVVCRGRYER